MERQISILRGISPTTPSGVGKESLPEVLWELRGANVGKSGSKLYREKANALNVRRVLLRYAQMIESGHSPELLHSLLHTYRDEDEQKADLPKGSLGYALPDSLVDPVGALRHYLAHRAMSLSEHPSPWLHNPDLSTHVNHAVPMVDQVHNWTPTNLQVVAVKSRDIPQGSLVHDNTSDNGEYGLDHGVSVSVSGGDVRKARSYGSEALEELARNMGIHDEDEGQEDGHVLKDVTHHVDQSQMKDLHIISGMMTGGTPPPLHYPMGKLGDFIQSDHARAILKNALSVPVTMANYVHLNGVAGYYMKNGPVSNGPEIVIGTHVSHDPKIISHLLVHEGAHHLRFLKGRKFQTPGASEYTNAAGEVSAEKLVDHLANTPVPKPSIITKAIDPRDGGTLPLLDVPSSATPKPLPHPLQGFYIHGTSKENADSIMREGVLKPRVGSLVNTFYSEPGQRPPRPRVFMTDHRNPYKAFSAAHHASGGNPEQESYVLLSKKQPQWVSIRRGLPSETRSSKGSPLGVEPGDYYSTDELVPHSVLTKEQFLQHFPDVTKALKFKTVKEAFDSARQNGLNEGDAYCPTCGAIFEWDGNPHGDGKGSCNRCGSGDHPIEWHRDGNEEDDSIEKASIKVLPSLREHHDIVSRNLLQKYGGYEASEEPPHGSYWMNRRGLLLGPFHGTWGNNDGHHAQVFANAAHESGVPGYETSRNAVMGAISPEMGDAHRMGFMRMVVEPGGGYSFQHDQNHLTEPQKAAMRTLVRKPSLFGRTSPHYTENVDTSGGSNMNSRLVNGDLDFDHPGTGVVKGLPVDDKYAAAHDPIASSMLDRTGAWEAKENPPDGAYWINKHGLMHGPFENDHSTEFHHAARNAGQLGYKITDPVEDRIGSFHNMDAHKAGFMRAYIDNHELAFQHDRDRMSAPQIGTIRRLARLRASAKVRTDDYDSNSGLNAYGGYGKRRGELLAHDELRKSLPLGGAIVITKAIGGEVSPKLINYMRGSKIVNSDGSPKTMWRGSPNHNAAPYGNNMIYLSPYKEHAYNFSRHGELHQMYVNSKNPFDASTGEHRKIFEEFKTSPYAKGIHIFSVGTDRYELPYWPVIDKLSTYLKGRGIPHDGIWVGEDHNKHSLAVYHPHQIKRVDASDFDPSSPNIHKSIVITKSFPASKYVESLRRAESQTHQNPSPAQVEAENFKKGSFQWKGLTITIENPKGSIRRGKNPNKPWEVKMGCAYGYFNSQPLGRDGDAVDVFVCDENLDSDLVFVVNQHKQDGSFDEEKIIVGCINKLQAKRVYLSCYSKGWNRIGSITPMTVTDFKNWLQSHRRPTLKAFVDNGCIPNPLD